MLAANRLSLPNSWQSLEIWRVICRKSAAKRRASHRDFDTGCEKFHNQAQQHDASVIGRGTAIA